MRLSLPLLSLISLLPPSTPSSPHTSYLSTSTPPSHRDTSLTGLVPAGHISLDTNVKRIIDNVRDKTSDIGTNYNIISIGICSL